MAKFVVTTIHRPRYVALGDKRSPMLRLLQECWNEQRGTVEVSFEHSLKPNVSAMWTTGSA